MEKKTFEQCCNEVLSEKLSSADASIAKLIGIEYYALQRVLQESADMYAEQEKKAYALEAVAADRERVIKKFSRSNITGRVWVVSCRPSDLSDFPIELP